jgi:aminoglycoside phosphotransferase (APT) family kinase protein
MAEIPEPVIRAAAAFGIDAARLRPAGGRSGSAWDAGESVLRAGLTAQMQTELVAMAAAGLAVPVPAVLDRVEFDGMTAVLLQRLPGRPAAVQALGEPARARAIGRACGSIYAPLSTVAAPAPLPRAPAPPGGATAAAVLHLDLHPLNILVQGSEITGVLDWANAAAGDPVLDRARSWSILNLDPAARAAQAQPGWLALAEGWAESGALHAIPAWARALACRFMLTDLAGRYSPDELAHVRHALHQAETAAARQSGDTADGPPGGTG